jgi:hypothetical protein
VVSQARFALSCCALIALAGSFGCGRKAGLPAGLPSVAPATAPDRAFGSATTILLQALTEPKASLHFSYKAMSQINPKFPREAGSKPEVAPVTLEADVSPAEITLDAVRGGKKTSTKAKKDNELDWAMAKLGLLGPMGDLAINLAFASPVAHVTGGETLGGAPANVYSFDTRSAGLTEKAGIQAAQAMLGGVLKQDAIYGTATVDKASGRMVKFSYDVEYSEKSGQTWKEHHEGTALPK